MSLISKYKSAKLISAVQNNKTKKAVEYLKKGYGSDFESPFVDEQTSDFVEALIEGQNNDIIEATLESGILDKKKIDCSVLCGEILTSCISRGNDEGAMKILDFQEKFDNPDSFSAAIEHDKKDMFETMVEKGMDVNASIYKIVIGRANLGFPVLYGNPIHVAMEKDNPNYYMVKTLLEHGAKADKANHDGQTAVELCKNLQLKNLCLDYVEGRKKPDYPLLSNEERKKLGIEGDEKLDLKAKREKTKKGSKTKQKKLSLKDILAMKANQK
jgi:hypothetical protein